MKIPLSKAKELEKRMGARVWDGLLFNRDSITNPMLSIIDNAVGGEIRRILALENPNADTKQAFPKGRWT